MSKEDVMRSVILTLPLILLFTISMANAQPGPIWQSEELGLSAEQQQKMEDMQFQHQKAMIQKRAQLKEAELEMRNMMRKSEIDEKGVLEQQRRVSALKGEIAEARMKNRLDMRKILTPEQREKMMQMRGHKDRFGKRRGDGESPHFRGKRGDCDGPGSGPAPGMGPR